MQIRKLAMLLMPIIFTSTHAYAINKAPGFAYPPYHIYPSANMLIPSGLSPAIVRNAYGFSGLAFEGKGQIIGIVDAFDDPNIENDLAVFNKAFNLPACTTANGCFQKVYARGRKPKTDASWSVEIALDVEWAHAIAPQAKIMLVEAATDSFTDLLQAVNVALTKGAHVISMSWGGLEFSQQTQFDSLFDVSGVTFTAAAGDSGNEQIYPAASPFVLSVGGTSLLTNANGGYISETAWSGSGGGLSAFESEPQSQSSLPIPENPSSKRGIPDVSYNADPARGFAVYTSLSFNEQSGWFIVGGTSAGAPQWAALVSLVNEAAGSTINVSNALYSIAKTDAYTANLNDVLSGSNGNCGYYCQAREGYDYITGLGSPKAETLVNTLAQHYKK